MEGLGSVLGDKAGSLGAMATLIGGFSKLGMDKDMLSKFAPIVISFLKDKGEDEITDLIDNVLGG